MATGNLTRLESYPFDSNPPTTYDDYGRPVYDRAVGARMLRYTYEQFFSDGVFGTPADALQIGKASTGLAVTIQPGMFIINGSIGAVVGEPTTLQLASSAPQGVVKYAVMLRYDNNQAYRSLYFRVVAGEAGGDVPAPETGTPEVKEYRLGYVTVPSGSTDMSAATVTNEKGTALCPYSAPFEEIDLSEIVSDAKNQSIEAMTVLLEEFTKYKGVVDSALDDSTATYLQQQITELQQSQGVDLTTEVDNDTIEYTQVDVDAKKYLRVKDGGIDLDALAQAVVNRLLPETLGNLGDVLRVGSSKQEWYDRSAATHELLWSGSWSEGGLTINGIGEWTQIALVGVSRFGSSYIKARNMLLLTKFDNYYTGCSAFMNDATNDSGGGTSVDSGILFSTLSVSGSTLTPIMLSTNSNHYYSMMLIGKYNNNVSITDIDVYEVWGIMR